MIYQENSSFKVFPMKATFNGKEQFINTINQFEKELLERLKQETYNPTTGNYKDVKLPSITYSIVSLTSPQKARLKEIESVPGITLDEVKEYVINATLPKSPAFNVTLLQSENAELWYENLLLKSKTDSHEKEIADLWFTTLTGGM